MLGNTLYYKQVRINNNEYVHFCSMMRLHVLIYGNVIDMGIPYAGLAGYTWLDFRKATFHAQQLL